VDDREDVRRFIERGLTNRGFETRTAAGASEALDVLDGGWRPDLLLSDVRMPVTSGPALVQMLRARGDDLPVIFMSGQHDDAPGLSPGDTVLAKPFTIDALVAAIGGALGGKGEHG